MSFLDWRPGRRADRPEMERFTCTEPALYDRQRRRSVHMRRWENDLQADIRTHNPADAGVYLGFDTMGLAAVYMFAFLPQEPGTEAAGYKLQAVAVAMRHRHQGGEVAWETITEALATITDDAIIRGYEQALVFAEVHRQNVPSQRMCERRGFEREGPAGVPEHDLWSISLACGG